MSEDPVVVLLRRLERWLAKYRGDFLHRLPPGASMSELADLERQLGLALPPELRALLAWHNGQGDDFIGAFEEDWLLMGTHEIAATRNDLLQDPDAGWHRAWVPFLDNNAGDFVFLDTGRKPMPVRNFVLDQDERPVIAGSLTDWLRDFVENVEKGNYEEDPERGRFLRKHAL